VLDESNFNGSWKTSPGLTATDHVGEKAEKVTRFIHKKDNSFGKFFDGINQQEKNEIENYMQDFIE
jgi:hypothetical protein